MTRALLPLIVASMLGALLRDLQVWIAAKIFCWHKRRQTQRDAAINRELHQLAAEFAAKEKAVEDVKRKQQEQQQENAKRVMEACKVPFPRLMGGPLIITARSREEVYTLCRQVSSNIAAQGTSVSFSDSNFEEN